MRAECRAELCSYSAKAMPVLGVAKSALKKSVCLNYRASKSALKKSVCLNYRASRGQRQRLRKVSVMKFHFNDRTEANIGLCRSAADNHGVSP